MQCPICQNDFLQLNSHHIYPTGFGGPQDGELFDLCAGCHQAVHSEAKAATSKSKNKKTYLAPDARKRAELLIACICKAHDNYKKGIVPLGADAELHEVSFHLNFQKLKLMHSAKNILGFKSVQALFSATVDQMILKAHGVDPNQVNHQSGILTPKRTAIRAQPPPDPAPQKNRSTR